MSSCLQTAQTDAGRPSGLYTADIASKLTLHKNCLNKWLKWPFIWHFDSTSWQWKITECAKGQNGVTLSVIFSEAVRKTFHATKANF